MDTAGRRRAATLISHATISTFSVSLSITSSATRAQLRKTNAGGPTPASRNPPHRHGRTCSGHP